MLGLLIFIGIVAFLILYPILHKTPTCLDQKKNGNEIGIDCGGICQQMCPADVSEPVVLWSRAFPVTGSIYNLLAYIENQNKNSAVYETSYEFRVYDTNNNLIGRREGKTFIPPNQRLAIFEARFDAGEAILKSVTFSFTGPIVWLKKEPTIQALPIKVDQISLDKNSDSPTLTARINNDSIYDLPDFDIIAILYDANHNAISVAKTHKSGLASNANTPVFFTWSNPFPEVPVVEDVLIQINPFTTSF